MSWTLRPAPIGLRAERALPLLALATLAILTTLPGVGPARGTAGATTDTLAVVDDDPVTMVDLDRLLAAQPKPRPGTDDIIGLSPEGVLKRLVENRLLEHEGYRMDVQEEPTVRNQVWELRRHRAMLALLDSVQAVVDLPGREELDSQFGRTATLQRVAHILLDDEATARALRDSLDAGVPFADLEERHSLDEEFAGDGGDLGWARDEAYIPAFRDVLSTLEPGGWGGPVQTERGWHLLQLTEVRTETGGQNEAMVEALTDRIMRDRVMAKMREYIASLREKYGVVQHDSLITTLDYGSEDDAVQARLKASEEPVVELPWRTLTVGGLYRNIRFQYFHGLKGRPDADVIRDTKLEEWVTELILRHEAAEMGYETRPDIADAAERLERDLVRDAVVTSLLDIRFDPSPDEVEAFWAGHPESFTVPPDVRLDAVLLEDVEGARSFRTAVEGGARVRWLAARTKGIRDADPAAFSDWVSVTSPDLAGLLVDVPTGEAPPVGAVLGPVPLDDAWLVATVREVRAHEPTPLDRCRDRVLAVMKDDRMKSTLQNALARLEDEADIRIEDDAQDLIAMRIDEWLGVSTTPERR